MVAFIYSFTEAAFPNFGRQMSFREHALQLFDHLTFAATLPSESSKKRKIRATDAERFKGIPVIKKYLDIPEEDKVCPVCNTPLVKIGEEFVRRELVFVPAKLKVIEIYSLNYSCSE